MRAHRETQRTLRTALEGRVGVAGRTALAAVLKADGTADCRACGMPMFPYAVAGMTVRLECANHHHSEAQLPEDRGVRVLVGNWIARRGAQLHAQHERWGTDAPDDAGRDERD